jgi:hypothetical protein
LGLKPKEVYKQQNHKIMKNTKTNWDDSHMKNTIGVTVKTTDGKTHSVNIRGNHPSPISQAMAYVSARYRAQGKGTPGIANAY